MKKNQEKLNETAHRASCGTVACCQSFGQHCLCFHETPLITAAECTSRKFLLDISGCNYGGETSGGQMDVI